MHLGQMTTDQELFNLLQMATITSCWLQMMLRDINGYMVSRLGMLLR